MQTQLPQRTLLSLALSLLFLSMAQATRGCSSSPSQLLKQLQSQANITGNTATLMEPYIRLQNLNTPNLSVVCREYPVTFPSEDTLRALSKPCFLNTVYTTLGRVWHRLGAIRQQFPKTEDFPELEKARQSIKGIRNNVYCMAHLLHHPLEIPKPTEAGSRVSSSTVTTPRIFQAKLDSCRFLWGYHCFMGSVGRVLREWGDGSSRRRRHIPRHNPLRTRHKGGRRTRPSRSTQSPVSRVLMPR